MEDVSKNIEKYNPTKKCNVLIAFDYMIADMTRNKKLSAILNELFIRERKLNISTVFITQFYFQVLKDVRLNWTYLFCYVHFKQTRALITRH